MWLASQAARGRRRMYPRPTNGPRARCSMRCPGDPPWRCVRPHPGHLRTISRRPSRSTSKTMSPRRGRSPRRGPWPTPRPAANGNGCPGADNGRRSEKGEEPSAGARAPPGVGSARRPRCRDPTAPMPGAGGRCGPGPALRPPAAPPLQGRLSRPISAPAWSTSRSSQHDRPTEEARLDPVAHRGPAELGRRADDARRKGLARVFRSGCRRVQKASPKVPDGSSPVEPPARRAP
jgi:hypothetical protein